MNIIIFNRLFALYAGGTATETTVRNAVLLHLITPEQYEKIVGTAYAA